MRTAEPINYFEVPQAHSGYLGRTVKTTSVCIYGIGHLGSWAARAVVALGIIDISVHDFDVVEERNISGSIYSYDMIGEFKTYALDDELNNKIRAPQDFIVGKRHKSLGYAVKGQDCAFPYQTFSDFYIVATDNAETRHRIVKTIFKHWALCGHAPLFADMNPVLIDMRSNGAVMEVISFPVKDIEMQKRYLKSLEEIIEGERTSIPCNMANIPQVPLFESAIVAQIITSHLRGVREYYSYVGSLLDLKTYPVRFKTENHLPNLEE
jgi:hypothetical protein